MGVGPLDAEFAGELEGELESELDGEFVDDAGVFEGVAPAVALSFCSPAVMVTA